VQKRQVVQEEDSWETIGEMRKMRQEEEGGKKEEKEDEIPTHSLQKEKEKGQQLRERQPKKIHTPCRSEE